MLYILSNVKKIADVGRVAAVILDKQGGMFRLKRLMEQLIKKLEERRETLNSQGLELLAIAYFISCNQCTGRNGLCGMQVLLPLRGGRDACTFPGNQARGFPQADSGSQRAVCCRSADNECIC